jgi:hypothetical protein
MSKVLVSLTLLFALIPSVSAHRYFFGLIEVKTNPHTQAVEIVHQYTLHDVQYALKKHFGDTFRLDNDNAESQIRQWVEKHVSLTNAQHNNVKPHWVGFEADYQKIWVYQEVQNRDNLCHWTFSNTLLMDSFSAQVNTVNVIDDFGNRSLILTTDNTSDAISCQTERKE